MTLKVPPLKLRNWVYTGEPPCCTYMLDGRYFAGIDPETYALRLVDTLAEAKVFSTRMAGMLYLANMTWRERDAFLMEMPLFHLLDLWAHVETEP